MSIYVQRVDGRYLNDNGLAVDDALLTQGLGVIVERMLTRLAEEIPQSCQFGIKGEHLRCQPTELSDSQSTRNRHLPRCRRVHATARCRDHDLRNEIGRSSII